MPTEVIFQFLHRIPLDLLGRSKADSHQLSIPSPDSTSLCCCFTVIRAAGSFNSFTGFHWLIALPCGRYGNSLLSIPSPDSTAKNHSRRSSRSSGSFNSFTGFHVASRSDPMGSKEHALSIPSPDSTNCTGRGRSSDSCTPFNSFTGFHKARLLLEIPNPRDQAFNSFTGFHGLEVKFPASLEATAFQFLHRIPPPAIPGLSPGAGSYFQFLHRIPHSNGGYWHSSGKDYLSIPSPDSTSRAKNR